MNILVSAYTCDPYRGSEAGVGWRAVCRIAERHDVFLLANVHNQAGWENARAEGLIPGRVQVRFVRGGTACSNNRAIARLQSWLNYMSYQRKVLKEALAWHQEIEFDLCHQLTIASWRVPSPLWRMPIPFVWGPIGGAGHMGKAFRSTLGISARCMEQLRDMSTWFATRTCKFRNCMRHATVVIAANEETERFLKPFRKGRPLRRLPIASFPRHVIEKLRRNPPACDSSGPLRIFAGGNMIGTKGLVFALRALKQVADQGVTFHYLIAGGGPAIEDARRTATILNLDGMVEFHPGFRGDEYHEVLHRSEVYLLPSFRESTPVTLLEAMLAGCYPVVADTSAQGEIVHLCGGHAVPVKDIDSLINELADAVIWCAKHREELPVLSSSAASNVALNFSSERYDATLEEVYRIALGT